jgi:hypothetical protein
LIFKGGWNILIGIAVICAEVLAINMAGQIIAQSITTNQYSITTHHNQITTRQNLNTQE